MTENKNISFEKDIKGEQNGGNTKTFTIELLINNNIYDSQKKNILNNNEFNDSEKIILDVPINYTNEEGNKLSNEYYIQISDLKNLLKKKGYPIVTSKIYIYRYNDVEDYVFINDDKEIITTSMISKNNEIKLKLKNNLDIKLINDTFNILKNHFSKITRKENESNIEEKETKNGQIVFNKRKRKIGDVVKSVYAQRMLFNGYYNGDGTKVKYNLKAASEIVNIPEKTLDDYLNQIRTARKYGFDFNKNKDEEISELRKFNEEKEKEFLNKKRNKNSNDSNNDNDT